MENASNQTSRAKEPWKKGKLVRQKDPPTRLLTQLGDVHVKLRESKYLIDCCRTYQNFYVCRNYKSNRRKLDIEQFSGKIRNQSSLLNPHYFAVLRCALRYGYSLKSRGKS